MTVGYSTNVLSKISRAVHLTLVFFSYLISRYAIILHPIQVHSSVPLHGISSILGISFLFPFLLVTSYLVHTINDVCPATLIQSPKFYFLILLTPVWCWGCFFIVFGFLFFFFCFGIWFSNTQSHGSLLLLITWPSI